jgi:hypothetical protein
VKFAYGPGYNLLFISNLLTELNWARYFYTDHSRNSELSREIIYEDSFVAGETGISLLRMVNISERH